LTWIQIIVINIAVIAVSKVKVQAASCVSPRSVYFANTAVAAFSRHWIASSSTARRDSRPPLSFVNGHDSNIDNNL